MGLRAKSPAKTETVLIPELCRQKLLRYAESFEELARSFAVREESLESTEESEETDGFEMDRRDTLDARRSMENKLLIRENLCEMAHIMTNLADEVVACHPMEERYQRLLLHALRTESIYASQFCYLSGSMEENRSISMTLCTDKKGGYPAEDVAGMLSVLLKRPLQLSAVSPYLIDEVPHSYVFVEEAGYMVLTGFCKATKEDEVISGDHYSILESEKGRMTLLLSDGTGSGEAASRDSERALDLMEKLLEAGYEMPAAVDMVNASFFAGEDALGHPTLDICDLDLYDGKCEFRKIGGVTSFIKRANDVEQITQGSLPLGIFRKIETEHISKQLEDGDMIIMMTDGMLEAIPDEDSVGYLERTIAALTDIGPGEIAEKLMELAIHFSEGHIRDDMTVLVAGIWENTVD